MPRKTLKNSTPKILDLRFAQGQTVTVGGVVWPINEWLEPTRVLPVKVSHRKARLIKWQSPHEEETGNGYTTKNA